MAAVEAKRERGDGFSRIRESHRAWVRQEVVTFARRKRSQRSRREFEASARRYLTESRLVVERVGPDGVSALCQGRHGTYELGYDAVRGWWCSCPTSAPCTHLFALRLVTSVDVVDRLR